MTPPRTFGAKAIITPMTPKMIATIARIKPQKAPVAKLRIAAMSEIMAGTLKPARVCPVVSMPESTPPRHGSKPDAYGDFPPYPRGADGGSSDLGWSDQRLAQAVANETQLTRIDDFTPVRVRNSKDITGHTVLRIDLGLGDVQAHLFDDA